MQWLSGILYTLFVLIVLGTVIVIIFDDGDSSKKIAWILVITILPIVGLLLYFMVGINVRQSWYFAIKAVHQNLRGKGGQKGSEAAFRALQG